MAIPVEVLDIPSREERRLRSHEEATRKHMEASLQARREANAAMRKARNWAAISWAAVIGYSVVNGIVYWPF